MTIEPTRLSERATHWRRRVFAATWLSYAGFYFCRKPFYVAKAALEETLDWDPAILGIIGTATLLSYAVGQFISGWAGDRYGPRSLLLIGMGTSIAANLLCGVTSTVAGFTTLMFLNGLAQSTGWSNNIGTMAMWFRREERGTVMGLWATNLQVGGILANTLAAGLLSWCGVIGAFWGGAAVLLAVWAFFLFNQRNLPGDVGLPPIVDEVPPEDLPVQEKEAGWNNDVFVNVALVGCFYFFLKFVRYALLSWTPYLLHRSYGLDYTEAGILSVVFDLGGILGVIACGVISDRYFSGRRSLVSLISVGGLVLSCGLLYTLGASSLLLFGTSLVLIGFTLYGPDALMSGAAAIEVGSARKAVLAAGIINGMGSFGSVLQELLLGALLVDSGDTGPVFATLLLSSLGAAACLGVLLWRNRTGQADV